MLNKQQMHDKIVELVKEYCDTYHNQERPYIEGERIPYASRVYDHEEMCNLVDSALEFWLTSGRYTDEFEKEFGRKANRSRKIYNGMLRCRLYQYYGNKPK